MPPSEKENKNKVGDKSGRTIPNRNARETGGQVWENGRNDRAHGNCNPEPNTEKPGPNRNRRQIEDKEGLFNPSQIVKPADKGDKKQAADYDQASANHSSLI